jgi:hypothetical protein
MVPKTPTATQVRSEIPRKTLDDTYESKAELAAAIKAALQVRKTPSWPRSWANSSLLSLYSHKNRSMGQLASFGAT